MLGTRILIRRCLFWFGFWSGIRQPLPVGDYGVTDDNRLVALVKRKSLEDPAKGLTEGTLAYQLADLATYPGAAVVVEERYSAVFNTNTSRVAGLPICSPATRSATYRSHRVLRNPPSR